MHEPAILISWVCRVARTTNKMKFSKFVHLSRERSKRKIIEMPLKWKFLESWTL